MKRVFIGPALTLACIIMLVGCGNKDNDIIGGADEPTSIYLESCVGKDSDDTNMAEEPAKEGTAEIIGPYGAISVSIPDTWIIEEAPVDSNKMMYGLYGLILKPADADDGQIELFCIDSFGVCGTGLEQKDITLAGGKVSFGTYDNHDHWDYIVFGEGKPQIVAQHTDCDSWTDEMWEDALLILDTMKFDTTKTSGGIGQYIPESEDDTIAVMMSVTDVTPSGLTVHFRQYDKRDTEELTYGQAYTLQMQDGDSWENVPTIIDNGAFTDEGYILPNEGEADMVTDWEWLYGKLSPGTYRITKTIVDSKPVGNNPLYFLSAQFVIAE